MGPYSGGTIKLYWRRTLLLLVLYATFYDLTLGPFPKEREAGNVLVLDIKANKSTIKHQSSKHFNYSHPIFNLLNRSISLSSIEANAYAFASRLR